MDHSVTGAVTSRPRALVVIHEATRTGAPIVGLRVLERMEGRFDRVCVLRRGGPLEGAFADRSEHLLVEPFVRTRDVLERIRRRRYTIGVHVAERVLARRVIAGAAPNLVYANSVVCQTYVDASSRLGIPSVLHSHELGVAASPYLLHPWSGRPGTDFTAVATSQVARHDLAFLLGVLPDQVGVLHPPVAVPDRALRRDPSNGLVVGAVGLVDPWKGPDLFVSVAGRVLSADSEIRFRWIGDGTELGAIRRRLAGGDLDGRISFPGPSGDIQSAYDSMGIFVLTSRLESLSVAALEAMAHGLPVVAFDVGGVREAVGDVGVLVPPGDVGEMSDAVLQLSRDRARREELGLAGRERVREHFAPEAFRDALDDVLARALQADR